MDFLPIENYTAYLADESRIRGFADCIVFPENTGELTMALKAATERGLAVTLQGARTGLFGKAVPQGGLVVCLERMNRILDYFERDGGHFLRVEAGATLGEIEKTAHSRGLFFPPDPTENTATIGGVFASGASGASGIYYGSSERYIRDIVYETADGVFGEKGAIAELTLELLQLPKYIWGVVFFFTREDSPEAFLSALQGLRDKEDARLVCAEYYSGCALKLLKEGRELCALIKNLPKLPETAREAIYIELAGDDEGALNEALYTCLEMFAASGGKEKNTWAESGFSGIRRFRDMRHAVPELIGLRSGIRGGENRRIEFELKGAPESAAKCLEKIRAAGEDTGIEVVVYGHVLQNHLNIALPYESPEGFETASRFYRQITGEELR